MSFFSSFSKAFSSSSTHVEEHHTKNSFAGTVHTPPPKKTQRDREIEQERKLMEGIDEVMEVVVDDEITEDIERMVKYDGKAYGTQQKYFRKAVLEKFEEEDGWFTCVHCGKRFKKSEVQADHIIPRNKGGTFSVDNGQILCIKCNQIKNDNEDETDEDYMRNFDEKKSRRKENAEFLKFVNDELN